MTTTKYMITTFVGRQKRYFFGIGKTFGNKLLAEYSTKQVDADLFDYEAEAKSIANNIFNPYDRVLKVEPIDVVKKPLEELMATLPIVVHEKSLDKKAVIKKVKKLK